MDREQLKTVQNQKVFVPLSAVMEVTENFNRLVIQAQEKGATLSREHVRGMAHVIKSLGLPITIPQGY